MRKPKALFWYISIPVIIGAALIFFNIKAGLAIYDAPEWFSPMVGDTFVSNSDGTVTVDFSVYANEPGASNQVRMFLQVIDDASSTPVTLDNGGYGSWVNSVPSNIPHDFATSTLAVKLDPIRKYRYVAWVINDSGVTTTAPTLENAIVPGSGFPPQSTKPTVRDENIVIATSSNMVHAKNNISFKFLDPWTGVNGYLIDRKIVGAPTWNLGATFYTYDQNKISLGHPNQAMFPDSECQSGRVCFSLNDPSPVQPNVVYQYRIRLAYRASISDPIIAPDDGGKTVATSSALIDIPTFDAITTIATSTHASSSMSLYFHAPAPLNSYGSSAGTPGFDTYQVIKIVNSIQTAPVSYAIGTNSFLSSPYYTCSALSQCYQISDIVLPGVSYQYLVRPCVTDSGQSRCADSWATSSLLTASNFLAVPTATAIGTEVPTSTPADSTITLHFRSQTALTAIPVTHYQIQVVENGMPRTVVPVIASTTNNLAGDPFFAGGLCIGNYRCFKLPTFSSTSADANYRITPGNQYVFRVRLAYLGASPYNNAYSDWIETSPVEAANLLPITLNPPSAVRGAIIGSNMISLEMDYVYDPTFLSLVKTIPGYSTLTGYEINKYSSTTGQVQYRVSPAGAWTPFMSDVNYVQAASGTLITNTNQTIGDQANEIYPTSTPRSYFYIAPYNSYYFQAKSINKYVLGQDSGYTQSALVDLKPLPDANNVQVSRYDVTNYDVGFSFDFANSGPTAFYVQWNTVQNNADPGWSSSHQSYVECTTNTFPCHTNIYGLDPTQDWYFRVIPRGRSDNQWQGYVKATSGTIPNIASPIVFSTTTNHSASQININFNQPNSWNGFNRYEVISQLGTWSGMDWTWANNAWAYNGTSSQNQAINDVEIETTAPQFNASTCDMPGRCYRVAHSNLAANPVIPGRTYRYLIRLCASNGGFCSSNPVWVTSTPVMAPLLDPIPNPEIPVLATSSTYTSSKITLSFKYTGGWNGLAGYQIDRQVNGGVWTAWGTYTSTQGATTTPFGCATPNTCYVQTDTNITPSSTYAYRVKVYSATPAVSSNYATSSPIVSAKFKVAGQPTDPLLVPRSCFGSGCFDLHVRFNPDLVTWINRYKAEIANFQSIFPILYFNVLYKKTSTTTWTVSPSGFNTVSNQYESSALYAAGKCTLSRQCYGIPVDSVEANQTYDVALQVYGYGHYGASWTYINLVNNEVYPMGQVTTLAALSGDINAPKEVGIISNDVGCNLAKLKIDYDYQSTLPALYRTISWYPGLPEGYQVTDRYWDHWVYTASGWTEPLVYTDQIQVSHNDSSWQSSGINIAPDKYITSSNTSLGDNNGELEYPDGLDYFFVDRSGGADTYLRANTINQYLTSAPPLTKFDWIGAGSNWAEIDWDNTGSTPINIASTTYTKSGKLTGLKDFPSMVILKLNYGDSGGHFNEWEAYLTIEYNYTKSGPTLYEIQQSDSAAPTGSWVASNPGEAVCISGNCTIHLTGLTNAAGKYQRFIRVRPKGTTIWMYKNDTVIWRAACLNIDFSLPTSTPGSAISASMINEVRQRINTCRASMGSSVGYYSFHNSDVAGDTDTQIAGQGLNPLLPGTRIRAAHVLELRDAIEEMYKSFASDPTNLKYRVTDWPAFWNKDDKGQPLPLECQNLMVGSRICVKHFSVIRQLLVDLEK